MAVLTRHTLPLLGSLMDNSPDESFHNVNSRVHVCVELFRDSPTGELVAMSGSSPLVRVLSHDPQEQWDSERVTGMPLLGVGLPVSGAWATRKAIVQVARGAEALGYAGLWAFQRTLWTADERLGAAHRQVLDPLVALAVAAAHTDRIGLGSATICAPFTAPVRLAVELASLDVVSEGRLTVGLGMGWMPQEYAAAGVPMRERGARFEEYLHCLMAVWTQDPVDFAGRFYTVPLAHPASRPMQRPHPPLLLGGEVESALRRAGCLAQGWIASSRHDRDQVGHGIRIVREAAETAGRDPEALRFVARVVPQLCEVAARPGRAAYEGTREQIVDDLLELGGLGVSEVILDLNLAPRILDSEVQSVAAAEHAEQVLSAFAPR